MADGGKPSAICCFCDIMYMENNGTLQNFSEVAQVNWTVIELFPRWKQLLQCGNIRNELISILSCASLNELGKRLFAFSRLLMSKTVILCQV